MHDGKKTSIINFIVDVVDPEQLPWISAEREYIGMEIKPENTRPDYQNEASESRSYPMRVALISQKGTMRTTWLPSTMEGRYKFLDQDGQDDLQFYIEAQNGRWVANSGRGGVFLRADPSGEEVSMGHVMPLSDKMLANLQDRKSVV